MDSCCAEVRWRQRSVGSVSAAPHGHRRRLREWLLERVPFWLKSRWLAHRHLARPVRDPPTASRPCRCTCRPTRWVRSSGRSCGGRTRTCRSPRSTPSLRLGTATPSTGNSAGRSTTTATGRKASWRPWSRSPSASRLHRHLAGLGRGERRREGLRRGRLQDEPCVEVRGHRRGPDIGAGLEAHRFRRLARTKKRGGLTRRSPQSMCAAPGLPHTCGAPCARTAPPHRIGQLGARLRLGQRTLRLVQLGALAMTPHSWVW